MYGYQEPLIVVSVHFPGGGERGGWNRHYWICFASPCELCSLTSSGLSSPVSKEGRGAWVLSENVWRTEIIPCGWELKNGLFVKSSFLCIFSAMIILCLRSMGHPIIKISMAFTFNKVNHPSCPVCFLKLTSEEPPPSPLKFLDSVSFH